MTSPSEPNTSVAELPLPSIASLVKATAIALAIAILLLVFVVLPAEYNIDPTGFGTKIGLTRLSAPAPDPVVTAAPGNEEADGDDSDANSDGADGEADDHSDTVVIEVPAGRGLEYKFFLRTGQKMTYNWKIQESEDPSQAAPEGLIYDFHGEPEGDTTGFYESYSSSNANGAKGTFTAPFDGVHGWYWNNNIYPE